MHNLIVPRYGISLSNPVWSEDKAKCLNPFRIKKCYKIKLNQQKIIRGSYIQKLKFSANSNEDERLFL